MPYNKKLYPKNWDQIALMVKEKARWICQECGKQCRRPGEPFDTHKRTLTVAHMNHNPMDISTENLKALCAPCHLRYDAKHHAETRKRKERGKNMEEAKRKVSETMTVFDAKRWQAMGYELEIENGEVTKISKRKAPHVPEHEAAVRCDV